MRELVGAEIICIIFQVILLIGLGNKSNKSRSTYVLGGVCLINIICCASDAAGILLQGKNVPNMLLGFCAVVAYSFGTFALAVFIYYCYTYVSELCDTNKYFYFVPMAVLILLTFYLIALGAMGKIFMVTDGTIIQTGGMPFIASFIQILFILYLPAIAIFKAKDMGLSNVLIMGSFGIFPLITSIVTLITGVADFSYPAAAVTLLMIYLVVENRAYYEREQKQQQILREKNRELEENRAYQEERYNVIKTMSSIYFAAYYIDLNEDTYTEFKTKENIKGIIKNAGRAQSSLYLACEKLIVPEFSEKMRKFLDLSTIDKRMEGKTALSCEYIGVTTGWSMAYLIAGDRNEDGSLHHIFYAARTIYDEKAREKEQKRKVEEYNEIIANAGMGVWHIILMDGEKPRMQANEKMLELLGIGDEELTEEEIYGEWYSRISPGALDSVAKSVQKMKDGEFDENTYQWNHPSLGKRYVRCGGTANILSDGTCILSGYHYDVTNIVKEEERHKEELALARSQAEEASNAKSRFLFSMSHDIRTPMNAIIGFTELLAKQPDDRDKVLEYVHKIRSSGEFLLALINNVLEVARIESGQTSLNRSVQKVGMVAEQIATIFDERMKAKGIDFTCSISTTTEYIYSDSVKTKEIYLNLVSNAYKYTMPGGKVSLDITELPCDKEGFAVFETRISDTGIGMSQEFLPHLFDDFSREKTVTEDGIEGTGLGMPIVKKLVELMNGTISVESEPGKGTTFTVVLPHKIAYPEEFEQKEPEKLDKALFAGRRILLAEDNEINAEIAVAILNDAGMEVDVAQDGVICIDMLQKGGPGYYTMILMDIQMPNCDGYQATKFIRAMDDPILRRIPIVAMTANAFEEDKRNALAAGMTGHLSKPIRVVEMLETIGNIIRYRI